jgi:ATP-binding cassette subfamily C protein
MVKLAAGSRLSLALRACRRHFVLAAAFSAIGNLLYLAPSIYMMQVYDRVLPSGGVATLVALSLIAVAALASLALFEWLRTRVLIRAGSRIDAELSFDALRLSMSSPRVSQVDSAETMRDVDQFRHGLTSTAALAAFDAPWTLAYILVAFLLHPAIGALCFVASVLLVALAWTNEKLTAPALRKAGEAARAAYARFGQSVAHAGEVRALGMAPVLAQLHRTDRDIVGYHDMRAGFSGAAHASVMKFVRLFLQSAVLALAAVLVINHQLTGGAMIAATLLLTRAIAPVEQIVGGWKTIIATRGAYRRLAALFDGETGESRTRLPDVTGALSVERLTLVAPATDRVTLADVSFEVAAGEIIGIAGPSGAGKSMLLKAIAGGIDAARGGVRIDGQLRDNWDVGQLSDATGYLAQDFSLFPGTIKDNISRFARLRGVDPGEIDARAVAAAQAIDAHDMILRLPNGYDSEVGLGGLLSGGQMQRIALARALYGEPRLVLLDEPTANLDAEAQRAFVRLLVKLRAQGTTVLFSSHDPDILAGADKLLTLDRGRIVQFASPSEAIAAARQVAQRKPFSFSPQVIYK